MRYSVTLLKTDTLGFEYVKHQRVLSALTETFVTVLLESVTLIVRKEWLQNIGYSHPTFTVYYGLCNNARCVDFGPEKVGNFIRYFTEYKNVSQVKCFP